MACTGHACLHRPQRIHSGLLGFSTGLTTIWQPLHIFHSERIFHIYTVAVNGNLIEYGIKCAKRTNITAKWSVNNNGKNNCHDQNCIFPYVQPANGTAHSLVQKYQRQSALQSSGRTDQLTEIGCSLAHYICEKQGKQNYKHQKNHVFQLSKKFVSFESTNFSLEKESYSADPGSVQTDREIRTPVFPGSLLRKSESDYVVGKFKVPASNHSLQGTNGTGSCCPGT